MTSLLDARAVAIDGRLEPSDLCIGGPSLVALIGPNGGGKTSLLRALAGVEDSRGRVQVEGETVATVPPARRARLVAFLPASREMIWPIAARDVVALGITTPSADRIEELLDRLELRRLADRAISQLSTGERSRVLLARALAAESRLLLLDEPLANLDPYWVLRALELLREAVVTRGCAAIVSLHDLSQVEGFNRLLLVSGGRVAADGDPQTIIGSGELADAFGVERDGAGWRIRLPEGRRSSP